MRTNVATHNHLKTHEGAHAQRTTPLQQLERTLLTCLLWEDTFYEDGVSVSDRIKELVPRCTAQEVSSLAIRARNEQKLRHAPLLLAREMCRHFSGRIVGDTIYEIIQRADELAEFVALYWKDGKQPLTKQAKVGLARAFHKFTEYHLAKYANRPSDIKLRDVLFLCHAKPRSKEQEQLWTRLIDGKLETPNTWEVALSGGADKAETFTRLIQEKQLGGLAFLRNLRNMVNAKVPAEIIREGFNSIRFDRVLPFRFISAAKYAPQFESELEQAMVKALQDTQKLPGTTALLVDISGSMFGAPVAARSEINRFEAAAALTILAREICEEVKVFAFHNDTFEVPARRGFALRDKLRSYRTGGTYGGRAIALANSKGYDRIIVLTDGQFHDTPPAPLTDKAYMFNIAPYQKGVGSGQWHTINGWSEHVLRYIAALEETTN